MGIYLRPSSPTDFAEEPVFLSRLPPIVERVDRELTKRQPVSCTPAQNTTVAGLTARLDEQDRSRLEAKGAKLGKAARDAFRAGDKRGFEGLIIEIVHRYEGDPNPLLLEFSDVLNCNDPELRIQMAGYFLLTNLKATDAISVLRNVVQSDKALPYGPENNELFNEESPPSDYRFRAAAMLALYRVEEAADNIWELYRKTRSKELVEPLRRLNHPSLIEEIRVSALKNLGTIENMELIGQYRFTEALPELKRRYDDKNSNLDIRFRTLYPLWRITGEEKYFDEFEKSFLPFSIPLPYLANGGEREHEYLKEMMKSATSDQLYGAAIALYLRFNDRETIKKIITEYYRDNRTSNWKDGILVRRFVGSINDPELTLIAEEYEAKYKTGFHDRYVVYRKKWSYARDAVSLFMD